MRADIIKPSNDIAVVMTKEEATKLIDPLHGRKFTEGATQMTMVGWVKAALEEINGKPKV